MRLPARAIATSNTKTLDPNQESLLLLQERYQENAEQNFSMAISRDNLASIVGTSKECVMRVLSEFKSDGIVETHQSEITLKLPEELRKIRW